MVHEHKTILWVKSGCGRCEAAERSLAGAQLEIRPIEVAREGEDPLAAEVMAQLAWQDWEPPVVMVDGEFVEVGEVLACRRPDGIDACRGAKG